MNDLFGAWLMKLSSKIITPLTLGAFLLSAVTGVLLFFHLDSGANKLVHEWLSWLLLLGAALHIILHAGAIKSYLQTKPGLLIVSACLLLLALSFLPLSPGAGKPPFARPVTALANTPLATLAAVANITPAELNARLIRAGFNPSPQANSLRDVVGNGLGRQMQVLDKILSDERGDNAAGK